MAGSDDEAGEALHRAIFGDPEAEALVAKRLGEALSTLARRVDGAQDVQVAREPGPEVAVWCLGHCDNDESGRAAIVMRACARDLVNEGPRTPEGLALEGWTHVYLDRAVAVWLAPWLTQWVSQTPADEEA